MADRPDSPTARAQALAEKAYAEAAEAIPLKARTKDHSMPDTETAELAPAADLVPAPEPTMDAADPVVAEAAPAAPKPERKKPGRKPAAAKVAVEAAPAPVKTRKAPAKRAAKPAVAKPAVAKTPARKAAVIKAPAKPAKIKPVAAKVIAPKPVIKPAARVAAAAAPVIPQMKDRTMEITSKISDGLKTVVSEAQDKAKTAFSKGTELLGEYTEFAKGNVEAVVESGKILATGLQGMGTSMVADTKESFETMTADVKAIAAVKSPTELVKLQGDMMRRNLDKAVALTSKNSEAMLKLANDMFAPLSGRFSLAMDKVRKAA